MRANYKLLMSHLILLVYIDNALLHLSFRCKHMEKAEAGCTKTRSICRLRIFLGKILKNQRFTLTSALGPYDDEGGTTTTCIVALLGGSCKRRGKRFPFNGLLAQTLIRSIPSSSSILCVNSSTLLPLNVMLSSSKPSSTRPFSSAMWK